MIGRYKVIDNEFTLYTTNLIFQFVIYTTTNYSETEALVYMNKYFLTLHKKVIFLTETDFRTITREEPSISNLTQVNFLCFINYF